MAMEIVQQNFRMIILKAVQVAFRQTDGKYVLNGQTTNGAKVECLINQIELDEFNKYQIFNTVYIYQHHSHSVWETDGFLPVTILLSEFLELDGKKALVERRKKIDEIKKFADMYIRKPDLNNADYMLLLCGVFIQVVGDSTIVLEQIPSKLVIQMIKIGARASWLYEQGESNLF
jgi:hypothetical protein